MLPFCFEWQWNADHFIFLGFLYLALIIIGCGLVFAGIKTFLQLVGFLRERHF
ncbi:MAG TPA: hypothetical protein VMW90_06170 [Acidobacteriota bacterium]|nr:hypothetical protein [Acidobacteriota bacterium]